MKRKTLENVYTKYGAEVIKENGISCGILVRLEKHEPELDLYEDRAAKAVDRSITVVSEKKDDCMEYRFYAPSDWFDENGLIIEERTLLPIKAARLESGLSQVEFSRRAKIPLRTVQGWESGERVPSAWMERLILREIKRVSAPDWKPED